MGATYLVLKIIKSTSHDETTGDCVLGEGISCLNLQQLSFLVSQFDF